MKNDFAGIDDKQISVLVSKQLNYFYSMMIRIRFTDLVNPVNKLSV